MSNRASTATASIPAAWERMPPASGVETSSRRVDYVLLRVSGLALSLLVLGHFAVTHLLTDVTGDDSTFVARRLSSLGWVAWDATMLAAALAHGVVGVRLALADYASGERARVLERAVSAAAVVLFVVGVVAIGRAAGV